MKLSPLCENIYLIWIRRETWHTSHPLDKRRFYDFVKTYSQYARKQISGQSIRNDIMNRYKDKLEPNYLEKSAAYYADLFEELVGYSQYLKG